MPLYESTFIARHDMSNQQVEGLAETFSNIIKENGGEVAKTELWGLKSLAYRIKKNRKGHYVHFNLDAPSSAVAEFERNMRLNEDVLRYLTIRVDELDSEPSVMMQSRDDRSRRGGGPPRGRGYAPSREKEQAAPSKATDDKGDKGDSEAKKEKPAAKTASETPAPSEAEPATDDKTADAATEKPASDGDAS